VDEASASDPRDLRGRYREIYRYVRRRSFSASDAEDVTQEVFADAARALGGRESAEAPPLAWLYTVAQNRLIDRARRTSRRREIVGGTTLEAVADPLPSYGSDVAGALRVGIARLPRQQQEVVVMKLVHGRSFAEIAAAVDAGEGACRMRFLRGLEQLRTFLEEQEVTP
jgi:RNA polymerase sigma-70 factor (ECF subfamily)